MGCGFAQWLGHLPDGIPGDGHSSLIGARVPGRRSTFSLRDGLGGNLSWRRLALHLAQRGNARLHCIQSTQTREWIVRGRVDQRRHSDRHASLRLHSYGVQRDLYVASRDPPLFSNPALSSTEVTGRGATPSVPALIDPSAS